MNTNEVVRFNFNYIGITILCRDSESRGFFYFSHFFFFFSLTSYPLWYLLVYGNLNLNNFAWAFPNPMAFELTWLNFKVILAVSIPIGKTCLKFILHLVLNSRGMTELYLTRNFVIVTFPLLSNLIYYSFKYFYLPFEMNSFFRNFFLSHFFFYTIRKCSFFFFITDKYMPKYLELFTNLCEDKYKWLIKFRRIVFNYNEFEKYFSKEDS